MSLSQSIFPIDKDFGAFSIIILFSTFSLVTASSLATKPSLELLFGKILRKSKNKENLKKDYIEGDFEDIEDDNDRKI